MLSKYGEHMESMVTVRVRSKLKTSWKSVVFTNKVGRILDILWASLIKQLFHSRLLDISGGEFGSQLKSRSLSTQTEEVRHLHIETHHKTLWEYPRVKNQSKRESKQTIAVLAVSYSESNLSNLRNKNLKN